VKVNGDTFTKRAALATSKIQSVARAAAHMVELVKCFLK